MGGEGLGGESQPIRAREERERKRVEAVCLSNGTPSGDPQMKNRLGASVLRMGRDQHH